MLIFTIENYTTKLSSSQQKTTLYTFHVQNKLFVMLFMVVASHSVLAQYICEIIFKYRHTPKSKSYKSTWFLKWRSTKCDWNFVVYSSFKHNIHVYIQWLQLATMVQPTYLITFYRITECDTTVLFIYYLFIDLLGMPPCELKHKTMMYFPKTTRMILGSLHISHDHQ